MKHKARLVRFLVHFWLNKLCPFVVNGSPGVVSIVRVSLVLVFGRSRRNRSYLTVEHVLP